jgi:hypothetical protein
MHALVLQRCLQQRVLIGRQALSEGMRSQRANDGREREQQRSEHTEASRGKLQQHGR